MSRIDELRVYCQDLCRLFHREKMPMPDEVTLEKPEGGIPGEVVLVCKFSDRTETWGMILDGNTVMGWSLKAKDCIQ